MKINLRCDKQKLIKIANIVIPFVIELMALVFIALIVYYMLKSLNMTIPQVLKELKIL